MAGEVVDDSPVFGGGGMKMISSPLVENDSVSDTSDIFGDVSTFTVAPLVLSILVLLG